MFSSEEGRLLARMIVAGVSIDGTLNKNEREQLSQSLSELGHDSLIADVGIALDNDFGDFDIFQDTKNLTDKLGSRAKEYSPIIFKIVSSCVLGDRFVSAQEANFLSALSRRLKLSPNIAGNILKELIQSKKGRIEIGGEQIDALVHPHLKELLSFAGSSEMVGEIKEDSLEERIYQAKAELENAKLYSHAEIQQALTDLGLDSTGTIEDAKEIWKTTLKSINLAQLADQGQSFVNAALNKAKKLTDAYEILATVDKTLHLQKHKKNEIEMLEKKRIREASFKSTSLENELEDAFSKVD